MSRVILPLLLFLFSSLFVSSCSHHLPSRSIAGQQSYERIDTQNVLFGVEYSFQDQEIVDEPGRMTFRTPHKAERFEAMTDEYLRLLGVTREAIVKDSSEGNFKPGYDIEVPNDGEHVINMEPVTIELNTPPKTINEVQSAATPVFKAAKKADLVPYVNSAAERSGMGHIHVGGKTFGESPFYKNPNLLRNMMVYFHKHPSLLYGFAEAYDIGKGSNIETMHSSKKRQEHFERAIREFDEWYQRALNGEENIEEGFVKFITILDDHEPPGDREFFHHYRVINLENISRLKRGTPDLDHQGKLTVEFRGFRPQKSAAHAVANAELLLDLMENLSDPQHIEPFEYIDQKSFKRFWTVSKVYDDWQKVKADIGHQNRKSDEMVREYVKTLNDEESYKAKGIKGAKVIPAYSQKESKGKSFELRIPSSSAMEDASNPSVVVNGHNLETEKVKFQGRSYYIAYIDTEEVGINVNDLKAENLEFTLLNSRSQRCYDLGSTLLQPTL